MKNILKWQKIELKTITDSHVRNYMTFLYFIEVIMMKYQERRIIVFDFEVTPSLWMVTFIDYHTKKQLTIINDIVL